MTQNKIILALLIATSAFMFDCKKEQNTNDPAGLNTQAVVPLTGTPSQQMVQIVKLGNTALKSSTDPALAAAAIMKLLSDYSIAGIRSAAKEAKAAGRGASAQEIAEYKAAQEEFKKLAEEIGGKNPAAFNLAAEAWTKAWN